MEKKEIISRKKTRISEIKNIFQNKWEECYYVQTKENKTWNDCKRYKKWKKRIK